MTRNLRKDGSAHEEKAKAFLEKYGIRIVDMNFRNRFGEIDLIGYEGDVLVFFEVKYRSSNASGYAEDAVNAKKRHTICKVADYYRMLHGIGDFQAIRFDVIAMNDRDIHWVKDAFAYC